MWTGVVRALACGAIRSFASTFLSSASRDVDLPWGVWERTACASATFVDSASDSAAPSSTRIPGSPVSTRASGIFFTFSPPFVSLCLLHLGYARPDLALARHLRRTPDNPSRIRRTLGPKAFAQSCEWEPLVTRRQRTRGGSEFDRMDMRVTDLVPLSTPHPTPRPLLLRVCPAAPCPRAHRVFSLPFLPLRVVVFFILAMHVQISLSPGIYNVHPTNRRASVVR